MAMPAQYEPASVERFIEQRIQERIAAAAQETATGNRAVLENLSKRAEECITNCQQAVTSCESNVTQLAAAAVDADNRISNGITANNKALDETKLLAETAKDAYNRMNELEVKLRGLNEGITELGVTWRSQIELLEQGFDEHVASRCRKFDADMLELQGNLIAKSESLRNELLVWSTGVDAQVLAGGGVPPGLGGKSGRGKGRLD